MVKEENGFVVIIIEGDVMVYVNVDVLNCRDLYNCIYVLF